MKIGFYEIEDSLNNEPINVQSEWEVTFNNVTGDCEIKWNRTINDPDTGRPESKILIFKGTLTTGDE